MDGIIRKHIEDYRLIQIPWRESPRQTAWNCMTTPETHRHKLPQLQLAPSLYPTLYPNCNLCKWPVSSLLSSFSSQIQLILDSSWNCLVSWRPPSLIYASFLVFERPNRLWFPACSMVGPFQGWPFALQSHLCWLGCWVWLTSLLPDGLSMLLQLLPVRRIFNALRCSPIAFPWGILIHG